MEALLIDEWLRGLDAVIVLDDASLTMVRERVRKVGADAGVPSAVTERACLVATEIGKNQLRHARAGRVAVRAVTRETRVGVEIIGADRGPGLADMATALDSLPRAEGTLGIGVSSIRRMSTDVDFDVRLGEGTRIVSRVFDREAPRQREVGVYGRPIEGETVSGDNGCFFRVGTKLFVGVCDGLGHGPPAREAAEAAMRAFDSFHTVDDPQSQGAERPQTPRSPVAILKACHAALEATRGVVMAVVEISSSSLEMSSVGNIDLQICSPRSARRFGGSSAIIGGRGNTAPRPRSESTVFAEGELLVMTTDGISSKLSIEQDLALLREHPVVVAQRIVERWARPTDDALVLVVR